MKPFLPLFISSAVLVAACTNSPDIGAPRSATIQSDTSGFAEFREWKNQQEQPTRTKTVYVVKHVPAPVQQTTTPVYNPTSTSTNGTADIPGASQPEAQPEKKGWSKAAKGAAIGAGSGAVLGAVIHKRNRVVGGVVGGAVGAGVGYGIGRHIDKKDGRF